MMEENAGFFALYQDFLPYLRRLSAQALRVYLYLGLHSNNYTGESWHSVGTIATQLGVDPRTIRRALNELVKEGLIARVPGERTRWYTFPPLPRARPLTGKALEQAAEAWLAQQGFTIVDRDVPVGRKPYRVVFSVTGDGGNWLVEVTPRARLNTLVSLATAARQSGRALLVLTAESWEPSLAQAAEAVGIRLVRLEASQESLLTEDH